MASANERQVAGSHYAGGYQHWDYVHDVRLGYHAGNGSKYGGRYRKKGQAMQDLGKCDHYIDKCEELDIPSVHTDEEGHKRSDNYTKLLRYAESAGLNEKERLLQAALLDAAWATARSLVSQLRHDLEYMVI